MPLIYALWKKNIVTRINDSFKLNGLNFERFIRVLQRTSRMNPRLELNLVFCFVLHRQSIWELMQCSLKLMRFFLRVFHNFSSEHGVSEYQAVSLNTCV